MTFIREKGSGMLLCLAIAVPAFLLGKLFPVIGGPVIAIIAGMIITLLLKDKSRFQKGIAFTSKRYSRALWCCWVSDWICQS